MGITANRFRQDAQVARGATMRVITDISFRGVETNVERIYSSGSVRASRCIVDSYARARAFYADRGSPRRSDVPKIDRRLRSLKFAVKSTLAGLSAACARGRVSSFCCLLLWLPPPPASLLAGLLLHRDVHSLSLPSSPPCARSALGLSLSLSRPHRIWTARAELIKAHYHRGWTPWKPWTSGPTMTEAQGRSEYELPNRFPPRKTRYEAYIRSPRLRNSMY